VNRRWFFMYLYMNDATYPDAPYTAQELAERGMAKQGR